MCTLNGKRYLGIDIGGTSAKYAIITNDGIILRKGNFKTGHALKRAEFLESIFKVGDEALQDHISGIGICSVGIINAATGLIMGGIQNIPCLEGINFKQMLSSRYPNIPVLVINDVKSIALGEQWVGAARNCKNFFCVALGTGLGGAIVLDSRLIEGVNHHAGEICYLDYYDEDNYLEKKASTQQIMKHVAKKINRDSINGFEFFNLVRQKNAKCIEVLEEWVHILSRFIANIIILLDIEKVIIGGGISNEGEIIIPRINAKVDEMLPLEFRGKTKIETALYANDAGLFGAVSGFIKAGVICP
jgi:predicted NBD/HSP70 family sugar kinase